MALSKSARRENAKRAWVTIRERYGPSGRRDAEARVKPELPKKDMPKLPRIKLPEPKSMSPDEMSKKALVFIFTCSGIGNHRKIDTDKIKIDADKALINVSKKLIDAPEYQAIQYLIAKARDYVARTALPATSIKKGVYLMSRELQETVDTQLTAYDEELAGLVEKFLDVYDAVMQDAKTRLKDFFNAEDYPTKDYLRQAFRLKWQCIKLSPPDQDKMKKALWEREVAKTEKMWIEVREAAQQALRANLAELVNHMADKLTTDKEGNKKIFKQASLVNFHSFLDTFDARNNITNDVQLKVLVDRAKELLKDTNADSLKGDKAVRDYVAHGFAAIKRALDPMIVNKPIRTIILED